MRPKTKKRPKNLVDLTVILMITEIENRQDKAYTNKETDKKIIPSWRTIWFEKI
jgi:hypothetical protein